jgi:hypothetical protein
MLTAVLRQATRPDHGARVGWQEEASMNFKKYSKPRSAHLRSAIWTAE